MRGREGDIGTKLISECLSHGQALSNNQHRPGNDTTVSVLHKSTTGATKDNWISSHWNPTVLASTLLANSGKRVAMQPYNAASSEVAGTYPTWCT